MVPVIRNSTHQATATARAIHLSDVAFKLGLLAAFGLVAITWSLWYSLSYGFPIQRYLCPSCSF